MLKSIAFAATLLLLSLPALAAPPRMDTLVVSPPDNGATRACAADQLCVEFAPSQPGCEGQACTTDISLLLPGGQRDPAQAAYRIEGVPSAGDSVSMEPWPRLIRFEGGGFLAGMQTRESSMYSGGGASASTLHLIAFVPGQPPVEVLSVPLSGHASIRACFSERDMKQRAGACHDEYTFDASLALAGASAAGMPVLRYRSKATSFPGRVSRSRDSLAARPLRQRDIKTVTDPQCSYQRLYRFDTQTRAYVPDAPVPDCSNYTVP